MSSLKTISILFRTTNTFKTLMTPLIESSGLTLSQFSVLEFLYHHDQKPVGVIAKKILIPNSSLSYVIEHLIKMGYVQKTQSNQDQRSYLIGLTKAGKKKIKTLFPKHEALLKERLDRLDAQEEKTLQTLLKKISLP